MKFAQRRRLAVSLLVIAGCVNYLDRAAVSVGNPNIRADLGLSYSQMGLLLSAFAWSYGLAQIPAGALIDKFGPRRALGAGLVLWSAAQITAGFVGSLSQFITARVALGLGESPMYIGGTRVCADWFALKDRALPISIFNSSSALAPALAPPLLTLLMVAFGWARDVSDRRGGRVRHRHRLGGAVSRTRRPATPAAPSWPPSTPAIART